VVLLTADNLSSSYAAESCAYYIHFLQTGSLKDAVLQLLLAFCDVYDKHHHVDDLCSTNDRADKRGMPWTVDQRELQLIIVQVLQLLGHGHLQADSHLNALGGI
jgi:hypothetical protein